MNGEDTYYMTNNIEYYEYITRENKLKHIDKKEATRKYVDLEEKREIGRIQSTFTIFKPQEELLFGRADIYRNGRLYGSWTKAAGAKLDGNKNYNVSGIESISVIEIVKILEDILSKKSIIDFIDKKPTSLITNCVDIEDSINKLLIDRKDYTRKILKKYVKY